MKKFRWDFFWSSSTHRDLSIPLLFIAIGSLSKEQQAKTFWFRLKFGKSTTFSEPMFNNLRDTCTRLSRGGAADLARRLSCSEHWDLCWAVIWDFRSETTTILELAHKPKCSGTRDILMSHTFFSWETIKRRSPIAGIVPECPDQPRFSFARCDFHDYYLLLT